MPKGKVYIKRFLFIVLILVNTIQNSYTQIKNLGLPYIVNYNSEDYRASKQNWAIVEDNRGVMYFGNTMGVLEFDGQNWRLISLPNNSIVRSLAIDNKGRIYVGSRGEFGYLVADSVGTIVYKSLIDKIEKEEDRKFTADIGRIFISNKNVYFTCEGALYIYSGDQIKVEKIKNLKQTFEVKNRIFVRIEGENEGIGEYVNGKVQKIKGSEISKDLSVRAMLPYDDKVLVVTMANGLYIYDFNSVQKLSTGIDSFLEQEKIVSAIQLADGKYALGLFSSGLLIIDKSGNVIQHLTTNKGLQSGLIPNLMQDSNGNLWLSTGNGITYILSSLPISIYSTLYALNSTIYSVIILNNYLYAASATGLFYRTWTTYENQLNLTQTFHELGEPMNIWSTDTLNGVLLAATNKGIGVIENEKLTELVLPERISVWKFLRIHGQANQIFVGTNKGFILLEYIPEKLPKIRLFSKSKTHESKGKWTFKSNVRGFYERCRHVEIDKDNNIWFSDKAKGIAKLKPVGDFDSVSVAWYNEKKGLPEDAEKSVFKVKNDILIGTDHGLFRYSPDKDEFIPDEKWNNLIGKGVKVTLMTEDSRGNIWFKQQRINKQTSEEVFELGQLLLQSDGTYILNKTPFYKFKNNIHSLSPLSDGKLIIGTDKGFLHYDPSVKKNYNQKYKALIRKIEFVSNDSLIFDGTFTDTSGYITNIQIAKDIYRFPYRFNNIRFTFSAPFFDAPEQIQFKYYLEGNDEGWSDWKTKNFKEYSNLKEGNYVFHVVAKNIYEVESEEAVYYFTISPPWYRTIWAIFAYIILGLLIIWGIVRLSVRRLRLQKEYLEKVVEERTAEIRMKNVELEQQKEEILAQRDEIEVQKDKIQEKNKNITASITYAKRIQEAMLPLREKIDQAFDDYFILFKPRDIVSGDFYWFAPKNNKIVFTAVDCTGHGVPGAFMSMIGSEILTTIVNQGITVPAEILDYMNRYVRKALKQDQTENQDGMDMSLCTIDKHAKIVEWAGAKNPMIYIQNNELFHLKGDMQSIGGHQLSKKERQFSNHIVSYESGPTYFYIFTDGYQDQFGGGKGRKFMVKSMKDMILEIYQRPMKEQHQIFEAAIEEWKSGAEQTDDILVIGFKLTP